MKYAMWITTSKYLSFCSLIERTLACLFVNDTMLLL